MRRSFPFSRSLFALTLCAPSLAAQDWIDAPRIVLPPNSGTIRKVADLDGDGDADLLVVQTGIYSTVLSLRAFFQEAGGFQEGPAATLPIETDVYNGQAFLELGDLTGDGLPDVVMDVNGVNGQPDGVRLLLNTGGSFGAPTFVATGAAVWKGVLADADADGTLELALLAVFPPNNTFVVGWWYWNGTTLVHGPRTVVTQFSHDLAAADLTGDGRSELFVGSGSGDFDLYSTPPSGQPEYVSTYHFGDGSSDRRSVQAGDLDGDGDVDLLVTWRKPLEFGDDLMLIVADNEGGALALGPTQSIFVGDERIGWGAGELADWDLDGDLDFLTQSEGLVVLENRGHDFALSDSMRTVRHDPYDPPEAFPGGGVADLTGDGFPDFAAGRYIYAGNGELGGPGLAPDFLLELGLQDFDADGDLDVFVLDPDSSLLENDGSGRLTPRRLSVPAAPAGYFFQGDAPPVDLDGDGSGDLLRVLRRIEYPTNPVIETRFMQGSAVGTFTNARAASAPGVAIQPAVFTNLAADLDDDGDPDVLGWNGYWENDGTCFFPAFHSAWSESPVRTADIDGDGDLDVLALTYAGALSLARNQGGVFTSEPIASQTGIEPTLGDLDGDGDLDLGVATSAGGPAVLLFENTGGTFAAPRRLDLGEQASRRVAFDDFDGDGRTDVLAMPTYFTGLEWQLWRQASAWQFAPPVTFLGDDTRVSGDLDGDGDLDFFGSRLVRSRRFDGPRDGRIRQHAPGWAGVEPAAPLLGARGPLRPGSDAVLRVSRARGGAFGLLLLSSRSFLPGPAGKARLVGPYGPHLAFTLGGTPGASGEGTFELPLGPSTLVLQGQTVWMQALIADPVLPRHIASTTNALELVFGR